MPTMTVLIGNMGDTVVRAVREATDWTGRKARVLPEYQHIHPEKKEEKRSVEVRKDQASSDSDGTRESPTLASPAPSLSAGRDLSLTSREGQETLAASPLESSSDEEKQHHDASDPSASQKPQQGKGGSSGHSANQVQAEAVLLAREISKLVKDVSQQPPKKYRWEEWVNWLKILGDEVADDIKETELEKIEVSMNLPQVEHYQQRRNRRYHRHHSEPNPHLKRKDGDGWDWTWLHDRGPLLSPQTETEWILSKLCSRLERLMNDHA